MKLRLKLTGMVLLTLFSADYAASQELGAWSFGKSEAANGAIIHSLAAVLKPDHFRWRRRRLCGPLLNHLPDRDPTKWSQWLKLEDSLSSRGQIELFATIDKKIPREEFWIVADSKRLLTRENIPDIAELRTAKTLKLSWNWGWSWLWLSDEASFELGDVEAVIFTLAKSCEDRGTDPRLSKIMHIHHALNGLDGALDLRCDGKLVAKRHLNFAP